MGREADHQAYVCSPRVAALRRPTPKGPSSSASCLVNPTRACLAAQYGCRRVSEGRRPAPLEMVTTRPRVALSAGAAARAATKAAWDIGEAHGRDRGEMAGAVGRRSGGDEGRLRLGVDVEDRVPALITRLLQRAADVPQHAAPVRRHSGPTRVRSSSGADPARPRGFRPRAGARVEHQSINARRGARPRAYL